MWHNVSDTLHVILWSLTMLYFIWPNDAEVDDLCLMWCIFYTESDLMMHTLYLMRKNTVSVYVCIKLNLLYCIWSNVAHTVSDTVYLMKPNRTHGAWSDHSVSDTMIWLCCKTDTLYLMMLHLLHWWFHHLWANRAEYDTLCLISSIWSYNAHNLPTKLNLINCL